MEDAIELSNAYGSAASLLGHAEDNNRDIVDLVMRIGFRLGLTAEQLRRLQFGALLHDVGKIHIPEEIIDKDGALTPEERALIERHPIVGEAMLRNMGGILRESGVVVRSTHERFDGLGYPDGLSGQEIPIESRIIACCDAFTAMTTDRPYRSALPVQAAVSALRRHQGTQFDPDVVEALIALADQS